MLGNPLSFCEAELGTATGFLYYGIVGIRHNALRAAVQRFWRDWATTTGSAYAERGGF